MLTPFCLIIPCRCHNIVGRCYVSFKEEIDKGLLSFQKELKINIEILGMEHSEVAITYQAMADFYRILPKKKRHSHSTNFRSRFWKIVHFLTIQLTFR